MLGYATTASALLERAQEMASNEDLKSLLYRCSECGQRFNSLGDMQRHITIEHMQKKTP
jgi:uncharacterized C2H2 Zn-finger protein